jgi:hypothetical protein
MHEEIQQWEIHPKFTVNPIFTISIGVLTGLVFGYLVQNLMFGLVLGLVAGAATTLALRSIRRDKSVSAEDSPGLRAYAPLLGLIALTVFVWAYQLILS